MGDGPDEYAYTSPWALFATSWSCRPSTPFRLALASFIPDGPNKLELLQLNRETATVHRLATVPHLYPATKVQFLPCRHAAGPDLLATTGETLRLWEISPDNQQVGMKANFTGTQHPKASAPITSFDWNEHDPRLIGSSSMDCTCSVWDITAEKAVLQLVAHDQAVFDIAFAPGTDMFGSVGADGSVRVFDIRNLDCSTIIYQSPDNQPTLRLSWNKLDSNLIATILLHSSTVVVLDIRVLGKPVFLLSGHTQALNAVQWSPTEAHRLCSGADDGQALFWNVAPADPSAVAPTLQTEALRAIAVEGEVTGLDWGSLQPDWLAVCHRNTLRLLRV